MDQPSENRLNEIQAGYGSVTLRNTGAACDHLAIQ